MSRIILVVHNVRSAHNVGSLLRTAEGLGVEKVFLTGYSPYPEQQADGRPPHIRRKVTAAISKTALGAEKMIACQYYPDAIKCLDELVKDGFTIVALEQTARSVEIKDFKTGPKLALIVGNEKVGIDEYVLDEASDHVKIPMRGSKESFNVSVAAAIALYHLSILDKNSS